MFLALAKRSFDGMRAVLVAVAAVVSLFQVAVVLQAASFDRQQLLQTLGRMLPAFVERWLGENIVTLGSFGGMVALGYFHPVVVLLVAIATAFVASDPAADVEEGYVDLLLSRPLARHWLITRSAALAVSCPLILGALMMAATWTTIALVARPATQAPSARTLIKYRPTAATAAEPSGVLRRRAALASARDSAPKHHATAAWCAARITIVLAEGACAAGRATSAMVVQVAAIIRAPRINGQATARAADHVMSQCRASGRDNRRST